MIVGLGWDEAKPSGGGGLFGALFGSSSHQAIDSRTLLQRVENGKFTDKTDLVYFGNLKHKSGQSIIRWETILQEQAREY